MTYSTQSAKGERCFEVVCKKTDGRELAFQNYTNEKEARAVAARLLGIGCAARVRRLRSRRESLPA